MKTAYDVVIRPIITEQSMEDLDIKKYAFEVAKDANKIEIKSLPRRPHRFLEKGRCQAERRFQEHRALRRHGLRRKNKWLSKPTDRLLLPDAT